MGGCYYGHHRCGLCDRISFCEADAIRRIPVLRYLKDPVQQVADLYGRYPLGGRPGWFVWSFDDANFAYWDDDAQSWNLLSAVGNISDLLKSLGINISSIQNGDTLIWNAVLNKFTNSKLGTGTLTLMQGGVEKGTFSANEETNKSIALDAGGSAPNNGTLTLTQGGVTKGTFSADEATNKTIALDAANNGTLTINQGGVQKGTFSANQSGNTTVNLDAGGGSTPNNGILTINQGGVTKGTFGADQAGNTTVNLDAGGVPAFFNQKYIESDEVESDTVNGIYYMGGAQNGSGIDKSDIVITILPTNTLTEIRIPNGNGIPYNGFISNVRMWCSKPNILLNTNGTPFAGELPSFIPLLSNMLNIRCIKLNKGTIPNNDTYVEFINYQF